MKFYECVGYPLYEITREGIVRNKSTQHICTSHLSSKGYPGMDLYIAPHEKKSVSLHRLLMLTFNPEHSEERTQINHIDGDKANYALSNLEWCTGSENMQHAMRTKLIKTQKAVCIYDIFTGAFLAEYPSVIEASRILGVDKKQLQRKTSKKIAAKYIAKCDGTLPTTEDIRKVFVIFYCGMMIGYVHTIHAFCLDNGINYGSFTGAISAGKTYRGLYFSSMYLSAIDRPVEFISILPPIYNNISPQKYTKKDIAYWGKSP